MPPEARIKKEDIVSAGVELVRAGGEEALNARAVAKALNCSTQPIFSNYAAMEDLRRDVIARAQEIYEERIAAAMREADFPPYKASGLAYIRFAREERQLFRLLFMRDRAGERAEEDREAVNDVLAALREKTGLSEDEAYKFHMEMWIWVHGVAVMAATDYLDWPMETVSDMMTDMFEGLRLRYMRREGT